ncbi:MAG: S8 family peptidase [Desulfobulbaceae bacterium]
MKRLRIKGLLCICAGVTVLGGLPVLAQEKETVPALILSDTVQKQLSGFAAEKARRTPAQKKMSSQLVLAGKASRGELRGTSLETVKPQVNGAADGTVLVDIKATVTPALLAEIEKMGGRIVNSHAEYDAIRAHVPLEFVETLAEEEGVRFIRPADRPFLHKLNTSEGDLAHAAASSRTKYRLTGRGVKVGVLSDSVDYLAQVQAAGDLPTVTVLENAPGNTGEGTAMLEIIHDLAPEAQLYFATAWLGQADFAANINALANAGCKVILDDVGYLTEFPFQDDIISQAVNSVTSRGVLYFSAAGNAGNLNDGTSGAWEGNYSPTASQIEGYSTMHSFGAGDWANRITYDGSGCFTLFWSDTLGGSTNDYDLFLLNPAMTAIEGWSDEVQDGTVPQDPIEGFCANPGVDLTNYHLVVAKWAGQDRFLHLSANRGELERATAGQIVGHAAAQDAFAVAAVNARNRTIPFVGTEKVETFSSDGPRRIFFTASGAPITPGNFSASGGTVRFKPDIAAADGVKTATPGFNPFYGTSAATPHAAAIGALMLSGKPGLTIAEARQVFQNTALDIETPGSWDRDSGYGILRADLVLAEAGPFGFLNPGIFHLLLRR